MIKKIISYIPGIIIPMVINFILTLLYASYLKPAEYGSLNIYLNSIQLIYSLSLSVFQTSSLRFYSLNEAKSDKEFISTYIFANIISTIVLVVPMLLVNLFLKYSWWIIAFSIGVNGLFGFWGNWYRLIEKAKVFNLVKLITSVITLVSLFAFSKLITPLSYIFPLIAIYGSYALVSVIQIIKNVKYISVRAVSYPLIIKSITYGFPLIGVSVLNLLVANSDQYLLLYYLGNDAVGNYALGYRLVDAIVANLLMVITFVMTPELNRIHDTYGITKSTEILRKMINAAIWMIMPISVAIIIYAQYIITFLYSEYNNAVVIMRLVVFASIFHGISMFTCKGLELEKKPKYVFYSLLVAGIVNGVYNLIFIPLYGINASAHSSIIAYVLYNVLLIVFSNKYYKITIDWLYACKVLACTIITCVAALLMMQVFEITSITMLIIQALICVFVYFICSVLLKLLTVFL